MLDAVAFYIFAFLAIVGSLIVVGQRRPMYSVMSLIASFGALAGLYVLLDAPFTAVTQIIIYAGAIMVLFLFVVMLLNVPREEAPPAGVRIGPGAMRAGVVLSVVLALEIALAFSRVGVAAFGEAEPSISSVERIGRSLFTTYAFAFEATSVLILVAIVGAVVVARKEP